MNFKPTAVLILLVASLPAFAATKVSDIPPCDPGHLGRLLVENLLARDYMLYRDRGLHYAEACTAIGALRYAEKTGNAELAEKLIDRYKGFLDEEHILVTRKPHVDRNMTGCVPLQIYLYNGDERFLKAGLAYADHQWEDPREDGLTNQTRWWIDDMYMVGILQIQAYRATGDRKYADRAAAQLAAYVERLQQPNGLFYHGPEFHYHWGRGNGWVAAAMAEVLSSLPEDHAHRPVLLDAYRRMMEALLQNQSPNGMWLQLVDYPYAWPESSCTAMFAYAMALGVEHGWVKKDDYLPAVEKAWKALCAHVDRTGNVREVCAGTGQVDDIEFYLNRPRILGDFHGQAPMLWLISKMPVNP